MSTSNPSASSGPWGFEREYFEQIHGPARAEREEIFKSLVKQITGTGRVLDIGCGEGGMMEQLEKKGWEVAGVEVSKYAIANCQLPIIHLDIEKQKLPFKDESFDLILLLDVVEHLKNATFALTEAYRVLKPGGKVVLTTPNGNSLYWKLFETHLPHDPTHINVQPGKYWIRMLERIGYKIIENRGVVCYGLPPGKVRRDIWRKRGWRTYVGPVYGWVALAGTVQIMACK